MRPRTSARRADALWRCLLACLVVGLAGAVGASDTADASADEAAATEGRIVVISLQVRQVDCDALAAGDGFDAMRSAVRGAILQKAGCWVDVSLQTSQCAAAAHGHGSDVMIVARVAVPLGAGVGIFESLSQAGSDPALKRVLEARVSSAAGVRPIAGSAIRITDLGAKAENEEEAAAAAAAITSDARELVPKPSEATAGLDSRGHFFIVLGLAVVCLGLVLGVVLGSTLRADRSRSAVTLVRRSVPEHAPKPEKWPILV